MLIHLFFRCDTVIRRRRAKPRVILWGLVHMGKHATLCRSKFWGTRKRRIVSGMRKKGLEWTGMEGVFPYMVVCGSDVLY